MLKFLGFIFCLFLGAWMVIKTEKVLEWFGPNEWAETKFGMYGGSRLFYKLFGILIVIVGTMVVTGWAEDLLLQIFVRK